MKRKQTTLVDNFNEIVESKDINKFIEIFDRCEINATYGYSKGNALFHQNLTKEMIDWFLQNGGDLEFFDAFGNTPLSEATHNHSKMLDLLLEYNIDVNKVNKKHETALHYAASTSFNPNAVKKLLKFNADPTIMNNDGETPLLASINRVSNNQLIEFLEISRLLVNSINIDSNIKDRITDIGNHFEKYRSHFAQDLVDETSDALDEIFKLYDVEPIIRVHKDVSKNIELHSNNWKSQFQELWDLLVPPSHHASSVQGEVIRICGKVSREILDNGGINWDHEYERMIFELPVYCCLGNRLTNNKHTELTYIVKDLTKNSDDVPLYRMTELVVEWVLLNKVLIPLTEVSYSR